MASSSYHESRCSCFWDYLVTMTRLWGVLTAVVMMGVGVDLAYYGHTIGTCVLVASLIVFFLEIMWAVSLFLQVCVRQDDGVVMDETYGVSNERSVKKCLWTSIQWCNKPSKKGVLYVLIGAVILLWPQHRLWLSPVAGVMLLLLATLYFLLTLKARGESRNTLLRGRDESFDRFDDVSDVLDDTLPEPITRRPTPHPNSLAAQLPSEYTKHLPRSASASHLAHSGRDPDEADRNSMSASSPSGGVGGQQRTHALVDGFGDQEIILRL